MSSIFSYLMARLTEGSTYAGLAAGLLAFGSALDNHATVIAALVAGVVAVLTPDAGAKK